MSEWQPIESAPKDGSWILLYHPFKTSLGAQTGIVFSGHYCEQIEHNQETGEFKSFGKGWAHTGSKRIGMNPTAWKPLDKGPDF